ncbi:MAG: hydantoinase/oxoprolinase family protein [Defluviicoccus sp.]|nr:hydantoinase/oxoprolinase family protein [Defluviicoccus sp.]MDE0384063.1 hydantoinase/oxoprolinase family protein [Defluviicoccus sp.]
MTGWMVGVDTGGTFTDLIAYSAATGERRAVKVPSVPDDPARAVVDALDELFATGIAPADIGFLVHGTTVATNTLIEEDGARAGLLITEGFRAVYEARGWSQPDADDLLDPFYRKPRLLVPQSRTAEAVERLDHEGAVLTPLDEDKLREAVRHLARQDIESLAVCYLFSFRNPSHERRTAEIVAEEAPGLRVSLSSDILPTIREYPRLSTTAIDAYVGPRVESYLLRLGAALAESGIETRQLFLMQSHGGLMRIGLGARFPNQTLLSGPAAGAVSGRALGALVGRPDVVTFDMGGTSTDIAVIAGGRIEETDSGRIAGQDIGTPMLSVATLGAGGGTIAHIGKDGLMKVGPRSAGADPGPACYGSGGTEPTVTDANLLLGALGPGSVLGGRMTMDPELARAAVEQRVAGPLELDAIEAASGIIRIVNSNMAVDLRLAFQRRGADPRDFALVAFGGAGPLHAAALAREVGIPKVVVPLAPGLNSAFGLLQTDVRHVYVKSSVGVLAGLAADAMEEEFAGLEARAWADLREEGFDGEDAALRRQIDMRYLHQGYQLAVDCLARPVDAAEKAALKTRFDELHLRVYGASAPDEEAETVTFRVIAEIAVPKLELPKIEAGDGDPARAETGVRELYDFTSGSFADCKVYDRALLRAGDAIAGPAAIEQFDSTMIVLAGQSATVEAHGNLVIDAGDPP